MSTDGATLLPLRPGTDPSLILIAEDEGPIAEALAFVVEDAGYRAVLARHGKEALGIARERPPALIITDLMMPHMSGSDLIAALRDDAIRDGFRAPPIILMTAAGGRFAGAASADAILRKPFDIGEVETLLQQLLPS